MTRKKRVAMQPAPFPSVPVWRHVALATPGPALPFRRRVQRRVRIAKAFLHTYAAVCAAMCVGMLITAVGMVWHG